MSAKKIMLIPAAGIGTRFGGDKPKQYLSLLGMPILFHTLQRVAAVSSIDLICLNLAVNDNFFLVSEQKYPDFFKKLQQKNKDGQKRLVVLKEGGRTRAETVKNAVDFLGKEKLAGNNDWLLTHDACRPCLATEFLRRFIAAVVQDGNGGIAAEKVTATVKQADGAGHVNATVEREQLWLAQTPQMFRYQDFIKAYAAVAAWQEYTDEAALMEKIGKKPLLVASDCRNVKITTAADYHYAAYLLAQDGHLKNTKE